MQFLRSIHYCVFTAVISIGVLVVPGACVEALAIDLHIPERYTDVVAGERVYFEVEVRFPENPIRQDLRIFYTIRDAAGEVVAQAQFLKAIETQASFIDYIVLPANAKPGFYVVTATIRDYAVLEEEVSASFHVVAGEAEQLRLYFFVLLGVVVFVGMLTVLNLILLKRHSKSGTRGSSKRSESFTSSSE